MASNSQIEIAELKDHQMDFKQEVTRYYEETTERLFIELIMEIEGKRRGAESACIGRSKCLDMAIHDLRAPLTVMIGSAQFLQNREEGENQELTSMILRSARKMLDLLNDLQQMSKLETKQISLQKQEQSLLSILEQSLKKYIPIAKSKNIEIEFAEDMIDAIVLIDSEQMQNVFDNLLSNAVKYSHQDTIIDISTTISNKKIHVSIKDQGIGIGQDEIDKVFTKFAKLSNKPTAEESTTGLGLAIVKKLVELHNGKIDVSSIYGKGSTFTISISMIKEVTETKLAPELSPAIRPKDAIKENLSKKQLTVLMIDDSQGARRVLAPILEDLGLKIAGEAFDGRSGLLRYDELRPDIVFLDVIMPRMSGVDVLKGIKEINPDATVVMLTSVISRERILASKKAGAYAYLLKPFESYKIEKVVNDIKKGIAQT